MKTSDGPAEGTLLFSIRVVPRASRNEVVGWTGDGVLKVRVTAPPVEGAANQEIVSYVARILGVKRSDIVITSGHHSKNKRLQVPDHCKNRLLSYRDI